MADIICEPNPGLLESMRSVGYDLNTAVADVIDNSIAAGANNIDIRYCDYGEKPYIAIVDDGNGMDRETAIHAMQLAGTNSEETRSANDLGRFGLGLKTASLSQCRSLMVTSLQHGNMSTFRWDLDHVAQTNSWTLEELSRSYTYVALPAKVQSLMPTSHGTCVLWRKLDRLSSVFGRNVQDLDRAMHDLSDYLGLVFHRFLHPYPDDTDISRIHIRVNGEEVPHRDPFLTDNPAVQKLPPQMIEGTRAIIYGYTLPYASHMRAHDKELLGIADEQGKTLNDTQGFYIYRANRLITWGSWFRMLPRKQATKLSRVRIDIPNSMDDEWTLDIKKSKATPPKVVRDSMKRFANTLAKPSRRVQKFRGRKTSNDPQARIWDVIQDRGDTFRYKINRDNPYVVTFTESLTPAQLEGFNNVLDAIAIALPYADIESRIAMDERANGLDKVDEMVREKAQSYWAMSKAIGLTAAQFVDRFKDKEPFALSPNVETILKKVTNE
ncbi:ATP-binding region ATPase domain-containing protein [Bifidobacterium pseudolongum subsp. globosum]|uniref:ATP-binding region ATPase domain-containing protein n=1 Tax=Bifidobacterium pseudolongum subsp. globosum TaxID=1690 RepID=A0A4Q5AGP7_9BIFI|nr:ATP-binding protein [Bifidobacterium pseudolongum]RYQ26964.1 ATP-binding region ATPase domain-containing protein [Bifidobacterium pseudolongum subsp. globosum]RYQ27403.1 ATP-binding region ATPase domain-containing protein [Bifidobacterium pseudolongum subsp. globosum]